jgi:hypothetical protein
MTRKTNVRFMIIAGLLSFLFGLVLIVCTFPVFSHTRQEVLLVPMSQTIMNSTFSIHEFEDKAVTFQASVGQSITILATSSGNISCSIANFTQADEPIQSDQPDIVYFSQNGTTSINKTWSPPARLPDPGKYYLIFLARDAPQNSPVHVDANVTKTWTDVQLVDVPAEDRIPLLDQDFVYVGAALVVFGTAVASISFSRSRSPTPHTRKTQYAQARIDILTRDSPKAHLALQILNNKAFKRSRTI